MAADWAQQASAIAAVIALGVGAWQLKQARLNSKEMLAKQMYFNALKIPLEGAGIDMPDEDAVRRGAFDERYRAYMRALLFACEEVLALAPSDTRWEKAIERILAPHIGYLQYRVENEALQSAYSDALSRLILRIIKTR